MTSIDNKKISLAYRHENSVSSTNKCMRQNSSYRHAVSGYPSFSVVLIQLLQFLDRWILSFGPQTMRLCTTILASTIVPRQLLLDNCSCIVLGLCSRLDSTDSILAIVLPSILGHMHCSRSLFQTRLYRFHPCNRTAAHPWTYALFSYMVAMAVFARMSSKRAAVI